MARKSPDAQIEGREPEGHPAGGKTGTKAATWAREALEKPPYTPNKRAVEDPVADVAAR